MPDAKDSLQVGSCVNLYKVEVSMVQKSIGSCHVLPWGCVLSEPLMDFRFSSIYCAWTAYKTSLGSGQGAVLPGRIDGHGTRNLSPVCNLCIRLPTKRHDRSEDKILSCYERRHSGVCAADNEAHRFVYAMDWCH